jgi:hypothetical protein
MPGAPRSPARSNAVTSANKINQPFPLLVGEQLLSRLEDCSQPGRKRNWFDIWAFGIGPYPYRCAIQDQRMAKLLQYAKILPHRVTPCFQRRGCIGLGLRPI